MGRHKGPNSDARGRLLEAAGKGFRTGGYGGAGVDGLAKEAGLTSGAFYAHFGSKTEAFRAALVDGMQFLQRGIKSFQSAHGVNWKLPFVDFYFGDRMQVALDEACALPTFTTDAARADDSTRDTYETEIEALANSLAQGLGGEDSQARAWQLLALFAGGASMARAVRSDALRRDILNAVTAAAHAV